MPAPMMVPKPVPENPLPPRARENLGSTSWKFADRTEQRRAVAVEYFRSTDQVGEAADEVGPAALENVCARVAHPDGCQ